MDANLGWRVPFHQESGSMSYEKGLELEKFVFIGVHSRFSFPSLIALSHTPQFRLASPSSARYQLFHE
jgi:hypothetical protein